MSNQNSNGSNESPDKPIIDDNMKKNVKSRNTWLRLFYMVLFALILCLAEIILMFVVIVQFFTVLLSSDRNEKLTGFGADMSLYIYDIWRYLSFVTEEQPFPFGEWRAAEADVEDSQSGETED